MLKERKLSPYLILSIIIHASLLAVSTPTPKMQNKQLQTVELQTGNSKKGDKDKQLGKVQERSNKHSIIPKAPVSQQVFPINIKDGYYGIGITILDMSAFVEYRGVLASGRRILEVIEGYPAYNHNLQSGDIIVAVNGEIMDGTREMIIGVDTTPIVLTIYRNGNFINVTIERDFILYDKRH